MLYEVITDNLGGRAPTPALDLFLVPPAMCGTERLRQGALGRYEPNGLLPGHKCFEIGVDFLGVIGETLFQF